MKKSGQKNTVQITAGEIAKLPTAAKVSVSTSWLRDYNKFAGQMGLPALTVDDAGEVDVFDAETGVKSVLKNVEVG